MEGQARGTKLENGGQVILGSGGKVFQYLNSSGGWQLRLKAANALGSGSRYMIALYIQ